MAKICPITNDKVLYLDCLECDDKVCLSSTHISSQSEQIKIDIIDNQINEEQS